MISLKKTYLFILINLCYLTSYGQESYARVKVNLENHSIQELASLGIEADHGTLKVGRYFINDFSNTEIEKIKNAGFNIEILIDDVVKHYEDQSRSIPTHNHESHYRNELCYIEGSSDNFFDFDTPSHYRYGSMGGYLTWDELQAVLDSMHFLYPELITTKAPMSTIQSYEGRDMLFVKISNNPNIEEPEPELLYTALHHAREPNSLSQMIFYMWYLLENYETDEQIKYIVDHTALYFAPCINPDGYVYNETTNPNGGGLWRKNRRPDSITNTVGVDLNRNYGYKWGIDNTGSSPDAGSNTYRGKTPFSEPELQAVKEFCEKHDFKITLNCHTHGNLLIHPWGYSDMPTDEHLTFKALGNEMIHENNFLFGTGTETVNYIVNGDSDDWMYGDQGIYAMTPEVGPRVYGFWPPSSAIDSLNKTAMYMNISAAMLVHPFIKHNELSAHEKLKEKDNRLELIFQNIGLLAGDISIEIKELTNSTDFDPVQKTLSLDLLQQDTVLEYFSIVDTTSQIQFEITVNNDNLIRRDTIIKQIDITSYNKELVVHLQDSMNNIDAWKSSSTSSQWGLSSDIYYSAPSSLTDSPSDNYQNKMINVIDLEQGIDLTNENYALLKFYAKWDIEKSWDYAQLLISTDKINYAPQCGIYTVNGNENQDTGKPLYDGKQPKWILEEIDLSDYLGKTIYLRFKLNSDDFENGDGIYIDDLEVLLSRDVNNTTSTRRSKLTISPNPVTHTLNINNNNISSTDDILVTIYNMNGTKVLYKRLHYYNSNIEVTNLSKGIYFVVIKNNNNKILSRNKLIKI